MSSLQQICATFETFGDCRLGRRCSRSHNVWPYRTVSAVATIVTADIELPGVITFLAESDGGNSRSQQYYIPRGQWFNAGATTGDTVEISISAQVHDESGCYFAKIDKILKSASTCQFPPLMPAESRQKRECFDFITFQDCTRGARCSYTHDVTSTYTQIFHVAEVRSMISYNANSWEVHVDVKSEHKGLSRTYDVERKSYYVLDKFSWNVREGNLVIIQESSK